MGELIWAPLSDLITIESANIRVKHFSAEGFLYRIYILYTIMNIGGNFIVYKHICFLYVYFRSMVAIINNEINIT